MISRFVHNTSHMLRKVSFNSQVNWTLSAKCNSWKEYKLFHCSSVSLKPEKNSVNQDPPQLKVIKVWKGITAREVARAMKISLKDFGLLVPHLKLRADEGIGSFQLISNSLHKYGWKLQVVTKQTTSENTQNLKKAAIIEKHASNPENLGKRPPVVTVMGHVDHGKTTLLDSLRDTFVVQQEFGGITQHIGAFSVEVKPGQRITFIDTPGHAAFTAMRSRGAEVTDIVVLVIAADDGVMEQTLESIRIATAAKVPIVVAVNKIDKSTALPIEDIKQKLLWHGVQVEDQGGDVQLVPISALKKINLDLLTEMILLQAEIMELKGDPTGPVEGVIIESKKGNTGIVATVIVKRGTLRREKIIVAGKAHARVRRMLDDKGKDYKEATPSTPVQILGWKELPSAGDEVVEVKTEKQAKAIIAELERKQMMEKQQAEKEVIERKAEEHQKQHHEFRQKLRSFTSWKEKSSFFFDWRQQKQREVKEGGDSGPDLRVLLKGDVYGSVEVLMEILGSYNKQDECKLSVINASVGDVKPSDVELAESSGAVIYAFNVGAQPEVKELLKEKNIDIRYHNVLYKLIDDIKEELSIRIPPKDVEEINGEAEVLANFMISQGKKKVPVAGCRCVRGQLNKDSLYRVLREGQVICEGKLEAMRNEKIAVKTISRGMECGLMFQSPPEKFLPGDKIICYDLVPKKEYTSWDPGF